VEEGRRIGAVADLKELMERDEQAELARQVLRAHWPEIAE